MTDTIHSFILSANVLTAGFLLDIAENRNTQSLL